MAQESFQKRLERFERNTPGEFILTLLNSIDNHYIPQLKNAVVNKQDHLLILGIHSIIETISEHIFLKPGKDGFKYYLENFVDIDKDGCRFSNIAKELNDWRNIIAHQFISKLGHFIIIDYLIDVGYPWNDETLHINPNVFFEQFDSAFSANGKIWDYDKFLSPDEMEKAKIKFIKQFKRK